MKPTVYCISTAKGGVLKTTSCSNLAASIAISESKKVLLLDFDGQGNLGDSFGVFGEEYLGKSMVEVLYGKQKLSECTINVGPNLFLCPSTIDMSFFDINAYGTKRPFDLLKDVFRREKDFIERFDYVFIDTPPNLSISVMNAYNVADFVLIPFQPERYGKRSLIRTVQTIVDARKKFKMTFKLRGIFAVLVDKRVNIHKANIDEVRKWAERNNVEFFDTVIKRSSIFASVMDDERVPLVLSKDVKRKRQIREAAEAYHNLKGEIINEQK